MQKWRGNMANVKSALEIALEKAEKIGGLSEEEKKKLEDDQLVLSILKEFYQGKVDPAGLWQKLKGNKPSLLIAVQMRLIESLGLLNTEEEYQIKKQGILSVESLKEKGNISEVEAALLDIESIQKGFVEMKEKTIADLRKHIEKNPQMRMQKVPAPDGRSVMQVALPVEEAVKQMLEQYLPEQEKQYIYEFTMAVAELKGLITG
jgi:hypothetical protein